MGLETARAAGANGLRRRAGQIGAAAAICLTALAVLPGPAGAALPKAKSDLIVPAKSIGSLALGRPQSAVTKAWGANKTCNEVSCVYSAPTRPEESPATANALLDRGAKGFKVWQIYIAVGEVLGGPTEKPNYDTPLASLKTAKGIGLGSTAAELKRAYPSLKNQDVGAASIYTLKGAGESATTFATGVEGKITSIAILAHPGG